MKRLILLLSICTTSFFSHSALAGAYFGVEAASVQVDNAAYSSSLNVGVFLGADFTEIGSNPVAFEVDISRKLSDGKVAGFNWSTQTNALFAAMRTGNEAYLKVKLGVHSTETTVSSSNGTSEGLAYGLGFGINNYEIEYTVLKGKNSSDTDINLISVGYRF